MTEHRLEIRSFRTQVAFTGVREDAATLGSDVTRAVREWVPAATGRALEPLLGNREGVLRIDRLSLFARLGRGELTPAGLAEVLAAELAGQVAERAQCSSTPYIASGVAFWPDHSSFAAAYVAHRLRLEPAPAWAFASFEPLTNLAAAEAVQELITSRPGILAALARLLGVAGAARFAASLGEGGAKRLITRLLEHERVELSDVEQSLLADIVVETRALHAATESQTILSKACTILAASSNNDAEAARRVVHVARLAIALAGLREAVASAWGRSLTIEDLAPEAAIALRLPETARRLTLAPLRVLACSTSGRQALARALAAAPSFRADSPRSTVGSEQARTIRSLTSRVAGIGLLLPTLLAHRVYDRLSPAAVHRLLSAALGPEVEAATRQDEVLGALAPCDPRDTSPTFPPVPATLRAVVPAALRGSQHELDLSVAEGAAAWAGCLTHGFAAELSGLELSTLGYLRRQFLARPGTLLLAEQRLTLLLDPLPLGVVLRLNGLHGWHGQLPHCQLRVEIREA